MSKSNQTKNDQATKNASTPNSSKPDSPAVSSELDHSSDAVPNATATAPAQDKPATPITSSSVQSWTAADVAKLPGLTRNERCYAHTHAAMDLMATVMQHTGAAFVSCQDVHFSTLHKQAQRIHQQLAESLANRSEFRGIRGLQSLAKKEVAQGAGG